MNEPGENKNRISGLILPLLFLVFTAFIWIFIALIFKNTETTELSDIRNTELSNSTNAEFSDSSCYEVKRQISDLEKNSNSMIFNRIDHNSESSESSESYELIDDFKEFSSLKELGDQSSFINRENQNSKKTDFYDTGSNKSVLSGKKAALINVKSDILLNNVKKPQESLDNSGENLIPLSKQLSYIVDYLSTGYMSGGDKLSDLKSEEREFEKLRWVWTKKKIETTHPDKIYKLFINYFEKSLFDILGTRKTENSGVVISIGRFNRTMVELNIQKRVFKKLPLLAIIIDDLGYGGEATRILLEIDPVITLAVLPKEACSVQTILMAGKKGFECMLHQPMEAAKSPIALGSAGLTCSMNSDQIYEILSQNLDVFPGVKGINNHMGSKFTSHEPSMRAVMRVLKKRGLYFIDSRTTKDTIAQAVAVKMDVPNCRRHVFLDNSQKPEDIKTQLRELVKTAQKTGAAIGIGHAHTSTALVIKDFIKKCPDLGVKPVKVSRLLEYLKNK
jgi:polysaccharide deacetylase 2 family uncharacterized protein YibQ